MVRNLEDRESKVDPRFEESLLGRLLGFARDEDLGRPQGVPEHERIVVRVALDADPAPVRREHVDVQITDRERVPRPGVHDVDPLVGDRSIEHHRERGGIGQPGSTTSPVGMRAMYCLQPDDVVGVGVAGHHDVEPLDAERRELRGESSTVVGTAVHGDRGPCRARDEGGISLPDVEEPHREPVGRALAHGRDPHDEGQHGEPADHGGARWVPAQPNSERDRGHERSTDQQDRPHRRAT